MMNRTVTFGEILGRIYLPNMYKFRQGLPGAVDFTFGGAEANVAASIAVLGGRSAFVTALPDNEIGEAALKTIRGLGVDVSHVVRTQKGRVGLYFVEGGANQRPSSVIYDRANSSVAICGPDDYDWDGILKGASRFHVTGITPSLSRNAAEAAIKAVKTAKRSGVSVSCDLNYRKKLWRYEDEVEPRELCRKTMAQILPSVDIIIGNEQDAEDVLGIKAGSSDTEGGKLDIARYPEVARQIAKLYPDAKIVAITLRESISATHNRWGAMLYDVANQKAFFAPLADGAYKPYEITDIVDRIGGGDSFTAGLLFALDDEESKGDLQKILNFAVAASCLCHSVYGDINYSTLSDVKALAKGNASGRVRR